MNINNVQNVTFGTRLNAQTKALILSRSRHPTDILDFESAINASPLLSKLSDDYEVRIEPSWFDIDDNKYGEVILTKEIDGVKLNSQIGFPANSAGEHEQVPETVKSTMTERGMLKEGICHILQETSTDYKDTDRLRRGFLVDAVQKLNIRKAVDLYSRIDADLRQAEGKA